MDSHHGKRNADEIISPDGKTHGRKEPKLTTEGKSYYCLVCLDEILNRDTSDNNDDEETIFCEGYCDSWVHRRCIGLTKKALISYRESNNPYMCPSCRISKYEHLISDMKSTIASLELKVSELGKEEHCSYK